MAKPKAVAIKNKDPTSSSTDTAPPYGCTRLCLFTSQVLSKHHPSNETGSASPSRTSMLEKFKRIKVQSKSGPPSIVLLSLQDSAYLPLGLPCMVTSSSSAITKMPQVDNTESKLTLVLAKTCTSKCKCCSLLPLLALSLAFLSLQS